MAALHTGKKRAVIQKAVKQTLSRMLPSQARYRVIYHFAKSNFDLQVADYCTWAVYKSLVGEMRPLDSIKSAIRSTFTLLLEAPQK